VIFCVIFSILCTPVVYPNLSLYLNKYDQKYNVVSTLTVSLTITIDHPSSHLFAYYSSGLQLSCVASISVIFFNAVPLAFSSTGFICYSTVTLIYILYCSSLLDKHAILKCKQSQNISISYYFVSPSIWIVMKDFFTFFF
jgi:hypothetical protein